MKTVKYLSILLLFNLNLTAQNFFTINGKIVDSKTNEPLNGAFINFSGKSQGITSNENGEFVLKFPKNHLDTSLIVSAFGYETRSDLIEQTDSVLIFRLNVVKNNKIESEKYKVLNANAKYLVQNAFSEINKLYPINPSILLGFYTEKSTFNDEFAQNREAIIKVERTTGTRQDEFGDKIKLVKGRSLENKQSAQIIRKHGFNNGFNIVTKSFESGVPIFFGKDLENYDFTIDSVIFDINSRANYVFEFKPENKRVKAARVGKLYIDTLTNAIVRMEYDLTKEGAEDIFKDNSFSNVKKTAKEVAFISNYRLFKGKWYLQDSKLKITSELENMLNSKLKALNVLDLTYVTTDILKTNGRSINLEEVMVDTEDCKKVKFFDDKFWQNYNFVLSSRKEIKNTTTQLERVSR